MVDPAKQVIGRRSVWRRGAPRGTRLLATVGIWLLAGSLPPTFAQDTQSHADDQGNNGRKILQDQLGESTNRRTRLYLKDGNYQVVVRYQVVNDRVRYISAERGGEWEEVPASLVDWDATRKWEKEHAPGAALQTAAPVVPIDPEDAKAAAEKAARMPEVEPNLFLPEDGGVLVLDTYHARPELAELTQTQSETGAASSHNILKAALNPMSVSHQLVELPGIQAKVQLHVNLPSIYVSLASDSLPDSEPRDFKVDTHGAVALNGASGGSPTSRYVIVRADVRRDLRVVGSFSIDRLGNESQSEIIVETNSEIMPGGKWMKLIPREPLGFGEYALMEVLSPREVNLGVWDFGVHPIAPENANVILPLVKKKPALVQRP